MNLVCEWCEAGFESTGARGRTPRFCSAACKQKSYRARRQRIEKLKALAPNRWTRAKGKRPIMVDGSPASSTNPATWTSWDAVKKSSAGDGFGVMLGDGLACIDLDHCFDDGVLNPAVREFIAGIAYPIVYAERSVSGNGLHVFVEAEKQRGFRRDGVEFYSWGRFIRTTLSTFIL